MHRTEPMKFKLSRGVGVDADVVGSELERIRLSNGSLAPSFVVDAARPVDAPLHPAFEWDDTKAADEFRLQQARNLIRCVQVVSENREPLTYYVHVPSERRGEGDYSPVSVVVHEQDRLQRAIGELQSRVTAAQDAVSQVLSVAELVKPKSKGVRKLRQVSEHLDAAAAAIPA